MRTGRTSWSKAALVKRPSTVPLPPKKACPALLGFITRPGNASSSPLTLKTMLILAIIGMPIVIGYTVWTYRTFKGKVTPGESY